MQFRADPGPDPHIAFDTGSCKGKVSGIIKIRPSIQLVDTKI